MFGPSYEAGCPINSSIADSIDGAHPAPECARRDDAPRVAGPAREAAGVQAAHGLEHPLGVIGPQRLAIWCSPLQVYWLDRIAVVVSILRYGFALALVDAAWALFVQIDVILIAAILDSTAAGQFQAPVRLLALVAYPGLAVANRSARVSTSTTERRCSADSGTRCGCSSLSHTRRGGDGDDRAAARPRCRGWTLHARPRTTRALAPWVLLAGLAPVASDTLDYLGRARARLPFAVGAVAVNGLIDVVLLQRIGVVAAAIGTDVGMAVFTGGTLWLCGRAVGYRAAYLVPDGRRAVAAGAVAAAIMLPVGLVTDDLIALAGSLVAATAAFGLIVVRPELGLRLRSAR